MNTKHPITPPTELVRQWSIEAEEEHQPTVAYSMVSLLATKAARWGAEQEMHAICDWLDDGVAGHLIHPLLCARRPKPPSLKEQALTALHAVATGANDTREQHQDLDTIRRALEALDD